MRAWRLFTLLMLVLISILTGCVAEVGDLDYEPDPPITVSPTPLSLDLDTLDAGVTTRGAR